jgi:hypothetical protein
MALRHDYVTSIMLLKSVNVDFLNQIHYFLIK